MCISGSIRSRSESLRRVGAYPSSVADLVVGPAAWTEIAPSLRVVFDWFAAFRARVCWLVWCLSCLLGCLGDGDDASGFVDLDLVYLEGFMRENAELVRGNVAFEMNDAAAAEIGYFDNIIVAQVVEGRAVPVDRLLEQRGIGRRGE